MGLHACETLKLKCAGNPCETEADDVLLEIEKALQRNRVLKKAPDGLNLQKTPRMRMDASPVAASKANRASAVPLTPLTAMQQMLAEPLVVNPRGEQHPRFGGCCLQ